MGFFCKIRFPFTDGKTNPNFVFGMQKRMQQKPLWIWVCAFGRGRRASIGRKKTNCRRSILDGGRRGRWMWAARVGGWGADSSDGTLFICRLKRQHSTPETSAQNGVVCTLTLTAEMRSVCSKAHPSAQRPFIWDFPVSLFSFTSTRQNTNLSYQLMTSQFNRYWSATGSLLYSS